MTEQEAYDRVYNVNRILRDADYSWREIQKFWRECIRLDTKEDVIKLHVKGLQDDSISQKLGVSSSLVGKTTTEYWKQKMQDKDD